MARKLVVQVVDDFDGKEVQDGLIEKVQFSLDGAAYLVELRPDNAAKLRSDFKKWIHVAQRIETAQNGHHERLDADTKSYSKRDLQVIRRWALDNGIHVSSRGRISMKVLSAFADAHLRCSERADSH